MATTGRGRVLVTRSAPGAESLARTIRDAGYTTVVMSMIDVFAVASDEVVLPAGRLDEGDAVVFLSVHAVTHGYSLIEAGRPRAQVSWVGVGAATCEALRMYGVAAAAPEDERSEGILGMPELAAVRRVVLVGGEGGRRLLDSALAARGVDVQRIEVYRRRPVAATQPIDLTQFTYVIVSSAAGGETLVSRATDVRGSRQPAFVVPSDRVAARMRELGVKRVIVSRGAGAAAVLSAMEESEDRDE